MSFDNLALFFLAFLGAMAMIVIGAVAVADARSCDPNVNLWEATIVHVNDDLEWQTPQTLLEYENGQRGVIYGYYGQPGDTFLIQRPAR